jgi:hypothetical protein
MDQIDRQDQEPAIRSAAGKKAFDARKRPLFDADALAFAQIWMREDHQIAADAQRR